MDILQVVIGGFCLALGLVAGKNWGEKQGFATGRGVGRIEGSDAERTEWWVKAHAAKDAGQPWFGLDYPVDDAGGEEA